MKALDAIRIALKFSDMGMTHLGSMTDAPLLRPGPWGGNHAMWIAGHLTVVEGRLQQMLHGTPNPVHQWKALFDWGSEPVDDLAVYPPFEEVVQKFKELRGQTHAFLDESGEEGLDRPTKCQPPGFSGFDTAGGPRPRTARPPRRRPGGLSPRPAPPPAERAVHPLPAARAACPPSL